jgi:glucokinase
MSGAVLAIDVGGTKFAAAVVDVHGAIRSRATAATPATEDPEEVAEVLRGVVGEVASTGPSSALASVGIGSAGPLDPLAGTVSPVNIPAWRDFDLVGAIKRTLPGRPVVLAGDGHCMALGEYWRGGYATPAMLGVVVSTGVGGGLVLDGRIYRGPTGNAGHIGHTVVELDGEACACGGRGCVETLASGPAMVRWALRNGWLDDAGTPFGTPAGPVDAASFRSPVEQAAWQLAGPSTQSRTTPPTGSSTMPPTLPPTMSLAVSPVSPVVSPGLARPDARRLAADARAGNPIAREAFRRASDALATAIVSASALIDLDDVVIGGGVAAAGDVLFQPLRRALGARAGLGFVRRTRVHASPLGADAGLLGAAALAIRAAPS